MFLDVLKPVAENSPGHCLSKKLSRTPWLAADALVFTVDQFTPLEP